MEELNQVVENNVSTPDTQAVETPVTEQPQLSASKPADITYTREQVTNMMKKRVERSHNAFFKRYNVTDLKGLDELFDKVNKFQSMQDEYGAIQLRNSDLTRENAFLRNNIEPSKYDDIVAHFKGIGQDFSEEALLEAISTHPEWLKQAEKVTTITNVGSEQHNNPVETEEARRKRIFGI